MDLHELLDDDPDGLDAGSDHGTAPLDDQALALAVRVVALHLDPPVTVRDADEVLRALVVAMGNVASSHAPDLCTLRDVTRHAVPLASVAAAGADHLAGPLDPPALAAGEQLARRYGAGPAQREDPPLAWSRELLAVTGWALEALDDLAGREATEEPEGPHPVYEHAETPRERAWTGLVVLLAHCLRTMAFLGLVVTDGGAAERP